MSNRQITGPTLSTLSFTLRHRELWPAGFEWDFSSCANCAIGLAHKTWPKHIKSIAMFDLADAIGMNEAQAVDIFGANGYEAPIANVTPEMVADKLDKVV